MSKPVYTTPRERGKAIAGTITFAIFASCTILNSGCSSHTISAAQAGQRLQTVIRKPVSDNPKIKSIVDSGLDQTLKTFEYDASYVKLAYPGGDVPIARGVCADVIVRAFRSAGVDLQKEIHEDMSTNFSAYPSIWGARKPDSNIDHRRVPNLMTFFSRKGASVPITRASSDYVPGDVISWELDNHLTHIGLVSDAVDDQSGNYLIVHNIGAGAKLEDVLFGWKITGHYRMWKQR